MGPNKFWVEKKLGPKINFDWKNILGQKKFWVKNIFGPINFLPKKCRKEKEAACKDPPKVVFQWRSSSTKGRFPLKGVFHCRLSSTKVCLSMVVVFHWRLSFTKSRLPVKVVFHQRLFSTKDCLPLKVVFTEGCLPPTIYLWDQSTYQISASFLA